MRKHNEGYALALVLVVMVVLSLVSVTILSFSLRNLQTQQAFVERMQGEYAAQGEIEKIVAQLEQGVTFEYPSGSVAETDVQVKKCAAIKEWIKEDFGMTLSDEQIVAEQDSFSCDLALSAGKESTAIECTVILSGKISCEIVESKETYKITEVKAIYKSYEVSTVTPAEGGVGE